MGQAWLEEEAAEGSAREDKAHTVEDLPGSRPWAAVPESEKAVVVAAAAGG